MEPASDPLAELLRIARGLREAASPAASPELRLLVADLSLAVADLRSHLDSQKAEFEGLRRRVTELESDERLREQLVVRESAYWFRGDPPAGRPAGPYCTGCLDARHRLVLLRELTPDLRVFGRYECPVCRHYYGEGTRSASL